MRDSCQPQKVCHISSAHNSDDARILYKECVSLVNLGYDVYFVVHGNSAVRQGVNIVGIGDRPSNRFFRMIKSAPKAFRAALAVDADIYHIHDPELLPYAIRLKKKGKRVIFDSHEDYLSTISEKKWIPVFLRGFIQTLYKQLEEKVIRKIDGAVVCYHWTYDRYKIINDNVEMILNYPIVESGTGNIREWKPNEFRICFAGGVTSQWCHKEIIQAIQCISGVYYELAGQATPEYLAELRRLEGWDRVHYHGRILFDEVNSLIYNNATVGMVLLDYIPQCKGKVGNISNTKFFEYMYAGIPLICTDFMLWQQIIEEEKCGLCVDPHNVCEITKAIEFFLNNRQIAEEMGRNGQKAIMKKYNWASEEKKMLRLYAKIL